MKDTRCSRNSIQHRYLKYSTTTTVYIAGKYKLFSNIFKLFLYLSDRHVTNIILGHIPVAMGLSTSSITN